MALVWASNNYDLFKKRNFVINNNIKTKYFNKEILNASFAVPNFLKNNLIYFKIFPLFFLFH